MRATILAEGERDLERAFDYYEARRRGLGHEMIEEFRRGVDRILDFPMAWQRLDDVYRRYRLHRFPYGIVYRVDTIVDQVVIVCLMHLSQRPDWWRGRE